MRLPRPVCWALFPLAWIGLSPALWAHPAPDIPVHTSFVDGKPAQLRIEIDPRCFEKDPEEADYVLKPAFESDYDSKAREDLLETTRKYLSNILAFEFSPTGFVSPEFTFDFAFLDGAEVGQEKQVLHVVAQASIPIPMAVSAYRVLPKELGPLAVQFLNRVNGKELPEFEVLTSGEKSSWLDFREGSFRSTAPPPPVPPEITTETEEAKDAAADDDGSFLSVLVPVVALVVLLVTVSYQHSRRTKQKRAE